MWGKNRTVTARLNDEDYRMLVDQLFGTLGALISALLGTAMMACVAISMAGDRRLDVYAYAIMATSLSRLVAYAAYQRRRLRQTAPSVTTTRRWEGAYAATAIAWIVSLGIACAAFIHEDRGGIGSFALVLAVGIAGGIAGRNASRPLIVIAQVFALFIPIIATLAEVPSAQNEAMIGMIVFLAVGVHSSTKSIFRALTAQMRSAREHRAIAGERSQAVAKLDAAVANMGHGLVMFGRDNQISLVNDAFREFFGMEPDCLPDDASLAQLIDAAIGKRTKTTYTRGQYLEMFERMLASREIVMFTLDLHDGRHLKMKFNPVEDGGAVLVTEDVTEKARADARIKRLAHHDELTGLANRARFNEFLTTAQMDEAPFSLFCLDLDMFKQINDTLGHAIGDEVLKRVAKRVEATIETDDVAARLGGDEFVVIQRGYGNETAAMAEARESALAGRLIAAISLPCQIGPDNVEIGVSIGISRNLPQGERHDILKEADLALYEAKGQGRGSFKLFTPEMTRAAEERRNIEVELRIALTRGHITAHYQPIVETQSGRVVTMEALARWRHHSLGMIRPDVFIPVAESSGLIVELGAKILQDACLAALTWPEATTVAVNMSQAQFRRGVAVEQVREALAATGLKPERLEIEITESMAIRDHDVVVAALEQIRALGVKTALDDFGTGFSSLASLHKLPLDKIKIDRAFVDRVTSDPSAATLIRLIRQFADTLGKTTVVEGVETAVQVDTLRSLGIRLMQGYVYARPQPLEEAGETIAKGFEGMPTMRLVASEPQWAPKTAS